MNCAYWGIPCIGNEKIDTQIGLFPELSIDANDIHLARSLAIELVKDKDFYDRISYYAKTKLRRSVYMNITSWKSHMEKMINE